MPETTQQIIERVGLIPMLRAHNAGQAHAVVQAMLAGGVSVCRSHHDRPRRCRSSPRTKARVCEPVDTRLGHRHHHTGGRIHHRRRRGVRGQPQLPS